MIFYVLLTLLSTTVVFLSQYWGKDLCKKLCVIVACILGVIASIRGYVGTDTYSYHVLFDSIIRLDFFDERGFFLAEPAYVIIAHLVDLCGGSSFVFVSVIGILQTLLLVHILTRIEMPALFLMFYIASFYFVFNFNIIRQGLSILFIAASLTWIKEGWLMFVFALAISALCHYSSFLLVPYMLIYKQAKERSYFYLVLLVPVIIMYFLNIVFDSDIYNVRYSGYFQQYLSEGSGIGFGFFLQVPFYIGLGLVMSKKNRLDFVFFAIPYIILRFISAQYPLANRYLLFFLICFVLLVTNDVLAGRRRQISNLILIMLIITNIFNGLKALSTADDQSYDFVHRASPYIPYHTMYDIDR